MKAIPRYAMCLAVMWGLMGLAHPAQAAEGDGWRWMVAPYLWAPSIGTNLTTKVPPSQASNDVDFDDIIDHISGAFEMHVEGQGGHFGMFADYTYLGLSDSHTRPHFYSHTSLDTSLFELAGVWNPSGESFGGFEVFGGLRYIDANLDFKLTPADPAFPQVRVEPDKSYSDFMLGARYTFPMSEHWAMTLRGDGSWGQTDGTWNTSAVAQYKTEHGAWLFGWRYLSISLKTANTVTDITINGPMVGYGFIF